MQTYHTLKGSRSRLPIVGSGEHVRHGLLKVATQGFLIEMKKTHRTVYFFGALLAFIMIRSGSSRSILLMFQGCLAYLIDLGIAFEHALRIVLFKTPCIGNIHDILVRVSCMITLRFL